MGEPGLSASCYMKAQRGLLSSRRESSTRIGWASDNRGLLTGKRSDTAEKSNPKLGAERRKGNPPDLENSDNERQPLESQGSYPNSGVIPKQKPLGKELLGSLRDSKSSCTILGLRDQTLTGSFINDKR